MGIIALEPLGAAGCHCCGIHRCRAAGSECFGCGSGFPRLTAVERPGDNRARDNRLVSVSGTSGRSFRKKLATDFTDSHGSEIFFFQIRDNPRTSVADFLPLCLHRLLLAYALADFQFHLSAFLIGVDDHMIAVQHFAVENLQSEWILHHLLNRPL